MQDNNKNYNLLLVDDERRITSALRAIFRRDYTVLVANSGEQALKLLAKNSVDVVLCDQRMPEMLGNELLAKISVLYPRIIRILLTGFIDRDAIVDSINHSEIYRFINKPWNNEKLRDTIAEAALASEVGIDNSENLTNDSNKKTVDDLTSEDDQALLMIEQKPIIRHQIRKYCRDKGIMIYGTQNIEQAIATVISRKNIGVAIIELSVDPEVALTAIGLLKQNRPDLITIALTDEFDASTAISLINQGQAYKYLTKPLDLEVLQTTVQFAFRRHHFLKSNKFAAKRYKVEQSKSSIENNLQPLFGRFLKIAALR